MIYAGIGSRATPDDILLLMFKTGRRFAEKGYTLRSGAADGADSTFEIGCDEARGKKEIFLPWRNFKSHSSPLFVEGIQKKNEATVIAEEFHPNWNRVNQYAKLLHTRNVFQILGEDLNTPTDFVVCYTPDGKFSGGTGQALRIAEHYNIPIYNLFQKELQTKINEKR